MANVWVRNEVHGCIKTQVQTVAHNSLKDNSEMSLLMEKQFTLVHNNCLLRTRELFEENEEKKNS